MKLDFHPTVRSLALALGALAAPAGAQDLIGPLPYTSADDSPFGVLETWIEDFEDHDFDLPGATISGGFVTSSSFSGPIVDSVDADDGAIDGGCSNCDSYFSASGLVEIQFATWDGVYPSFAGLVWVDGSGTFGFEAFDARGASLGTVMATLGDGSFTGGTAEDRFFGVQHAAGVSRIRISGSSMEIDHVQVVPPAGAPGPYCAPKTTSNGCVPSITYAGTPSATSGSGFVVGATSMINNKACILLYGLQGPNALPYQGGVLCVKPPIGRTPVQFTGGTAGPNDCSGAPAFDMNAFAVGAAGGAPAAALLQPGTAVVCQWWGRDPGFSTPNDTQLSNALHYAVGL